MNIQNNIKSPCMGCIIRFPMCHDCCENYETYKQTCVSIREGRNELSKTIGIAVESANRQKKCRSYY